MKTIMSFDGGGVRGAISVAFLERIEQLCAGPPDLPLARKIDLAGGTSTGAIVSGAVALGMSSRDIRDFYFRLAPKIFRRSRLRIPGLQSVFDAKSLKDEIRHICGDRELDTPDLLCAYALVMKRIDTGSAWLLSNNPRSGFWDDPPDGSYIGNRHYRLGDLIRASTAAPHYFQPEVISVIDGAPPGLFVDGGVTPHNNPALALLQLVSLPAYGYEWPLGVDQLRIISVGTGSFRTQLSAARAARTPASLLAVHALAGLIQDCQTQTLMQMQMLGKALLPWPINSEVGDLAGFCLPQRPLFEFVRYDVNLDQVWLQDHLGIRIPESEVQTLRQMDNPDIISRAYDIGQAAAEKMVKPEHLTGIGPARPTGLPT